jgi:2-polyprenyl-3-methyl-5-hydroxy-6-metoxy-1,4-benzoquinol methylase
LSQTPPSPELYFDTIFAFQRSAALKSAIDLDLFTAIGDGARTAADIAAACRIPERGARVLADYLTTIGFITKTGGTYELTPDSVTFLSKRSPAYLGGTAEFLYSPELTDFLERLTDTIRAGTMASSMVDDENPQWVRFARAMPPMMMPSAQAIAEILRIDSTGPVRVLDIAAGHGIFGIVLAQRNPQAEIVAVDWAPVLEVAKENAAAMGVGPRHTTIAGDAFKVDYGSGFDVVLVTNFIHHFDRPTNVDFLRKTAASLKPGGRVVVLEFVPNEDRVTPPMAARFSLAMLAFTPAGDAYTLKELSGMLAEAGFSSVTAHPLPGPETVIVATKRP